MESVYCKNLVLLDQFILELLKNHAKKSKLGNAKLFGGGIESYMVIQKATLKFLNVPVLVRLTANQIILKGLTLEGVFRVPGNHNLISDIASNCEKGVVPNFYSQPCGPEEVAGIFKKYLRELPSPLLADDSLDNKLERRFAEVEILSPPKKCARLRHLIKKLNVFRRYLAKEMFYVLYLVSLQSDTNKMDATNLATIFGGMVNIISTTMTSTAKSNLCKFIIEHYPIIFNGMDELTPKDPSLPVSIPEGKRVAIRVYTEDGMIHSFITEPTILCKDLIEKLSLKSKTLGSDISKHKLFELLDRSLRLISEDEKIVPIINGNSILFFSGNVELACLIPHIPDNAKKELIGDFEEEPTTDEEVKVQEENVFNSVDIYDLEAAEGPPTNREEPKVPELIAPPTYVVPPPNKLPTTKSRAASLLEKGKRTASMGFRPLTEKKEKYLEKAQEKIEKKNTRRSSKLFKTNWRPPKDSTKDNIDLVDEEAEDLHSLTKSFMEKEKNYLNLLHQLIKEYKEPLLKENCLTSDQANELFCNIDAVHNLHKDVFHKHLSNPDNPNPAAALLQICKSSTLYSVYQDMFSSESKSTLQALQKDNERFVSFLANMSKSNQLQLGAALETPLFKLKEYSILNQKFLHCCPEGHAAFSDHQKAQSLFQELFTEEENEPKAAEKMELKTSSLSQEEAVVRFGESDLKKQCQILLSNETLTFYSTAQKKFGRKIKEDAISLEGALISQIKENNSITIKIASSEGDKTFYIEDLPNPLSWFQQVENLISSINQTSESQTSDSQNQEYSGKIRRKAKKADKKEMKKTPSTTKPFTSPEFRSKKELTPKLTPKRDRNSLTPVGNRRFSSQLKGDFSIEPSNSPFKGVPMTERSETKDLSFNALITPRGGRLPSTKSSVLPDTLEISPVKYSSSTKPHRTRTKDETPPRHRLDNSSELNESLDSSRSEKSPSPSKLTNSKTENDIAVVERSQSAKHHL